MKRRSALALCCVVVLVMMSSCSREDNSIPPVQQEDRIVQTASLSDDGTTLVVTWDPVECETFQNVDLELDEGFANLRIRVLVDVENCPPGGFKQSTVDLGEPLGDRKVWDRAFGDTVALTP
jgi:hypothetical protein